jgi:hypothetical protein
VTDLNTPVQQVEPPRPAQAIWLLAVGWLLRAGTAAALVIDGVVHIKDAYFYDANTGALLSQGQLFRIQGVIALVLAAAVLVLPRRPVWGLAFLVAASAFGAVVLYTYVDVGSLAGLPNMYEPSWGPPGKLLSGVAEGVGALLALGALAWATHQAARRRGTP